MRNCWAIFKNDWKSLGKNAISWMVVVGLIVIPSLYGWFCIYAFWDPYGHTETLKVAVACDDEGFESSLAPVTVNIGKEVREELRDNPKLDWVFVDRETALEGVNAGEYYAALVIPEDFSRNLLSILSEDVRPAEIMFYLNEKENAIAAKVTNQGAGAVQETIDEAVARKASELALGFLRTVSEALDSQDADALAEHLMGLLRGIQDDLTASAATADALCAMSTALDGLLYSTDQLLREIGENTTLSLDRMPSEVLADGEDSLNGLVEKFDAALGKTDEVYDAIDRYTAQNLEELDDDVQTISQSLDTFAAQIDTVLGRYETLRQNVEELSEALPPQLDLSRQLLNEFSVSLDRSIRQQTQIRDALQDASSDLSGISADAVRDRQEIANRIADFRQALSQLRSDYQKELQPQLRALADALADVEASAKAVVEGLRAPMAQLKDAAGDASQLLSQLDGALSDTRDLLRDAAEQTDRLIVQLTAEGNSSEILDSLLRSDDEAVSGYLSSVVKLDRHVVFPVANFGSGMAPFYSSLAIWFGAIVLVAMLKADVSDRLAGSLQKPKNWQLYLGRYGIFLVLCLLQSLLLALGDLFFLGVTCAHPVRFVVTCLFTGFVFVTVVYTLTVSFGNIGKALAVILLVFQVAGSGGTIPIEMTPPFFHRFYPLLPITHSMAALRECIGGMYENTLLKEYGILFLYVGFSWLLGLVLRNPMIRLNRFFTEKIEETKVM